MTVQSLYKWLPTCFPSLGHHQLYIQSNSTKCSELVNNIKQYGLMRNLSDINDIFFILNLSFYTLESTICSYPVRTYNELGLIKTSVKLRLKPFLTTWYRISYETASDQASVQLSFHSWVCNHHLIQFLFGNHQFFSQQNNKKNKH